MRTRLWISCALTAALVVGCSSEPPADDGEATADADGADEGDAVEEPSEPDGVTGSLDEVVVVDLSNADSGLVPDGASADQPVPTDEDAVDASVAAAVSWLDAHLTDLQAGGTGAPEIDELAGDAPAVSSGMADPEHPVLSASYSATVGARREPEWLRMSTVVERDDGELTATFVFVPAGPDEVTLVAVQVGDGTPAPTAATDDGGSS